MYICRECSANTDQYGLCPDCTRLQKAEDRARQDRQEEAEYRRRQARQDRQEEAEYRHRQDELNRALDAAVRYGDSWGYNIDKDIADYKFVLNEDGSLSWDCRPKGAYGEDEVVRKIIRGGFFRRMSESIKQMPPDAYQHLMQNARNAGAQGLLQSFYISFEYKGFTFHRHLNPGVSFNLDHNGMLTYTRHEIFSDKKLMREYDEGVTEYIQRNKEKHVNEILRSREAQQQAERKDFRDKILMSAVVALIAIGGAYLFYKNSKNEAANFNSTAESIAAESLYSPDQKISECFDVSKNEPRFLKGRLDNKIFPGPPNFEDVQTGDTPEPTFILQLHKPICVRGDEWSVPGRRFQDVHLVADSIRSSNLHELVGQDVEVSLKEHYGAHTGHHRAPLVANVIAVRSARAEEISDEPVASDGKSEESGLVVARDALSEELVDVCVGSYLSRNVSPNEVAYSIKVTNRPLSVRLTFSDFGFIQSVEARVIGAGRFEFADYHDKSSFSVWCSGEDITIKSKLSDGGSFVGDKSDQELKMSGD
jgi:hypothetical protein